MESKTKHRLLGLLVIIGLIIIILPFLQSSHELTPDTAAVKAPAFPEQTIQTNASADATPLLPPITVTVEPPKTEETNTATNTATNTSDAQTTNNATTTKTSTDSAAPEQPLGSEVLKNEPDDTIKTDHPVETNKSAPAIEPDATKDEAKPTSDATSKKSSVKSKAVQAHKKVNKETAKHFSAKNTKTRIIKNNELFDIKEPAWVIQVGSYNNKATALRVVNRLRQHGYHAFIQQFSASADSTRVFVGPANQQSEARTLVQDIKKQMNMQGVVISYKPLTL